MVTTILLKRGKSSSWETQNLLLQRGEPGFETDTGRLKIGDGVTLWNDLGYIGDDGQNIANAFNLLKSQIENDYATKMYVDDLIESLEMPEGSIDMIALTTQEILDICK